LQTYVTCDRHDHWDHALTRLEGVCLEGVFESVYVFKCSLKMFLVFQNREVEKMEGVPFITITKGQQPWKERSRTRSRGV
jgi:hypothetical protein